MNSLTKRLMAGVAAAATLLSGMALAGSAMADTAIPTADLDTTATNQTLTVTADSAADLSGKKLYAIRLAKYSAAQVNDNNITGYDVADAGLKDTVNAALKGAGIVDEDGTLANAPQGVTYKGTYDSSNPMQWVVQNLLDSSSSPYSGRLRDFLTKLAAQNLSTYKISDNEMTISNASATKSVAPGVYVIIDELQTGDGADGKTVVSMPMMTGTGITSGEKSYTKLQKSDGTTIDLNTVRYKATKPTVDKKIVETVPNGTTVQNSEKCSGTKTGETEKCVGANTAAIGDTVTYELTTTVPNYTGYNNGYYLALNDTLSKGLTFGQITSVKIEGNDTNYADANSNLLNAGGHVWQQDGPTNVPDNAGEYTGGQSFSIKFGQTATNGTTYDITDTKFKDIFVIGKKITVRYTATLNKDAVINGNGNPNKVNLTYSRNPNGVEHGDSDNVEVKTYTGNLKLHKVDAKGNNLKDAQFEIRSSETGNALKVSGSNGNYVIDADQTNKNTNTNTALVVPEGGILTINGLNGTYYFKETHSPLGATALPSFTATVNVLDKDDAQDSSKKAGNQTVKLDKQDANKLVVVDSHTADGKATSDADIKVTNVHNFTEMPKTGATWLCIYAAMAVLCGGGAFLLLRSSKKRA